MKISDAQRSVDSWINSSGIRYFNELTNMALLAEEVGELARIMSRVYGEQSFKEGEKKDNPGEEMADILFVLICLANQTGVDLSEEFKKGMVKRETRDRERHKNNPNLKSRT